MKPGYLLTRLAAGVFAAGALVAVPGAAAAQETAPAPNTVDSEQVRTICDNRVPRIERRIEKVLERVDGGPEVVGSTAWLQERTDKAAAAGRERLAARLQWRLDHRPDLVAELEQLKQRVADFRAEHCGDLGNG